MQSYVLAMAIAVTLVAGDAGASDFEFAPFVSVPLLAGSYPDSVKVGDVDGDRLSDVVLLPGDGTSSIEIFHQRADGTLASPIRYTLPQDPTAYSWIALADLNADGVLDIASGHKEGLTLLLSDGVGSDAQVEVSSGDCSLIHVADFDGDGAGDIFCQRSYTYDSYIMRGDGHGNFATPYLATSNVSYFSRAYVGDASGDGMPDILFADGSTIQLFTNRGDGTFLTVRSYGTPFGISAVSSGDINADGLEEVIAAGFDGVLVYKQDGNGELSPDYRRLQSSVISTLALTKDFDRDGRIDVLVGDDIGGSVGRYMQLPDGLSPFIYRATIPMEGSDPMTAGDIDDDGCMDVMTTSWSSLNMLRGLNCVHGKVHGDFDGDGIADLLWHNQATGASEIWKSADSATVQAVTRLNSTDWRIAATGDFDGDGKADVVWHNAVTGAGTIWKSGNYATQQALTRITDPAWAIVGAGDFDGDGKDDLLWHHAASGKNAIWKSGNYHTQQAITMITDLHWQVVGSGDFDGDGKDDILWRHATSGSNAIWKGGDYRHQQAVTAITNVAWKVGAIGDFDGDGNDDLFWHLANGSNTIWRSAAYGQQLSVPKQPTRWTLAAAADYDGNGKDDLVWRNTVDGSNVIWRSAAATVVRPISSLTDSAWRPQP